MTSRAFTSMIGLTGVSTVPLPDQGATPAEQEHDLRSQSLVRTASSRVRYGPADGNVPTSGEPWRIVKMYGQ
jgi:hypothetical protein